MKKLFAFLLVMVALCAFAGIGVYASTLEEDARALVEGTIAITSGETHSIKTPSATYSYAADRRYAQERYATDNWMELLFFGKRKTTIYLPGKTIHYYPDRGFYYEENANDENRPFFFEDQICHMPAVCDLDQLTAEMSTLDGKDCLVVHLPFSSDIMDEVDFEFDSDLISLSDMSLSLYYVAGDLKKISVDYSSGLSLPFTIIELTAAVDESAFQPSGNKIAQLLVWLPNRLVSIESMLRLFLMFFPILFSVR